MFVTYFETSQRSLSSFQTTVGSVAEWVKASFLRQPDRRILSSTHTLVTLLRPWIRRFTILSLLGGFEQAANLRGKKSKRQQESLENC